MKVSAQRFEIAAFMSGDEARILTKLLTEEIATLDQLVGSVPVSQGAGIARHVQRLRDMRRQFDDAESMRAEAQKAHDARTPQQSLPL